MSRERLNPSERAALPAQAILRHLYLYAKKRTSVKVKHGGWPVYVRLAKLPPEDKIRLYYQFNGEDHEVTVGYVRSRRFGEEWMWVCGCRRQAERLFLSDEGIFGCYQCARAKIPQIDRYQKRLALDPERLLAYIKAANTPVSKRVALRLYSYYVGTLRRWIKRSPGKLAQPRNRLRMIRLGLFMRERRAPVSDSERPGSERPPWPRR